MSISGMSNSGMSGSGMSGSLMLDDGATMMGSLFIAELPDWAVIGRFCRTDPFPMAKLSRPATVRAFFRCQV